MNRVTALTDWLMATPNSLAYWKSVAKEGEKKGYDPLQYLAARQSAAFAELTNTEALQLSEWTMLAMVPTGKS